MMLKWSHVKHTVYTNQTTLLLLNSKLLKDRAHESNVKINFNSSTDDIEMQQCEPYSLHKPLSSLDDTTIIYE